MLQGPSLEWMDSPSASMWAVQPTAFRLVAAIANWVASQHDPVYHGCDQLQVTCLRRNTVSCDEVRFCDIIVHLSIFNSEIMTRIKRTETPTDGVNELGVLPVCYNSLPNENFNHLWSVYNITLYWSPLLSLAWRQEGIQPAETCSTNPKTLLLERPDPLNSAPFNCNTSSKSLRREQIVSNMASTLCSQYWVK